MAHTHVFAGQDHSVYLLAVTDQTQFVLVFSFQSTVVYAVDFVYYKGLALVNHFLGNDVALETLFVLFESDVMQAALFFGVISRHCVLSSYD